MPVNQNLPLKSMKRATEITKGKITLSVCEACSFIFNSSFDASKLNYSDEYNNNQSFSIAFKNHMGELVSRLKPMLKSQKVIEVGCGKGDFLTMIANSIDGITAYGFDPSYISQELVPSNITFIQDYYGPNYRHIKADAVICRHVIEHIEDPVELLKTIRSTLFHSTDAKVYFETPCVDWILKNRVPWDFFYEHCSYFNELSLRTAFENSGFTVDKVEHVFGGQYLWIEASPKISEKSVTRRKENQKDDSLIHSYLSAEQSLLNRMESIIQEMSKEGGVALWGAGAKGVTFANLLDPFQEKIECLIDINEQKQGKFIPGSGHPIVSDQEIRKRNIQTVLVMNPLYYEEISLTLLQQGITINVIEAGLYAHI